MKVTIEGREDRIKTLLSSNRLYFKRHGLKVVDDNAPVAAKKSKKPVAAKKSKESVDKK